MISYQPITNLIFEPKGMHDPNIAYTIKDTVMSENGSQVYFALKDVPEGIQLDNTEYWIKQIDLSESVVLMQNATDSANDAISTFGNCTKDTGLRLKGEFGTASGDYAYFLPDAGSLLQPVTTFIANQKGVGVPYPIGCGTNFCPFMIEDNTFSGGGMTAEVTSEGMIINGEPDSAYSYIFEQELNLAPGTYYICDECNSELVSVIISITGANGVVTEYENSAFVVSSDDTLITIRIDGNPDQTECIDHLIKPMLNMGDTPLAFALYSNEHEIIGYDSLELNCSGKNLIEFPYQDGGAGTIFTHNGITFAVNTDGSVNIIGTASGDAYFSLCNRDFGDQSLHSVASLGYENTNGTFCVSGGDVAGVYYNHLDKTTYIHVSDGSIVNEVVYPCVEYGTEPTEYFSYLNNNYKITLGQTVYGGRFYWTSGEAVIDHAMSIFDGSDDEAWVVDSESSVAESGSVCFKSESILENCIHYDPDIIADGLLCNIASPTSLNEILVGEDNHVAINGTSVVVRFSGCSTVSDLTNIFATMPMQIVYPTVPVQINVTPCIIPAIEPEQINVLHGDGNVEVQYIKPLHVSIRENSDMLQSTYDQDGDGVVDDAAKLGGKLPSEYATAEHKHDEYALADHTHEGLSGDTSGMTPEDIGAAPVVHTHDYNTLLNIPTRTLLWENPNPSAEMAEGAEINLSSGDYDELVVYYMPSASSAEPFNLRYINILRGHNAQMLAIRYPSSGMAIWCRYLTYKTDTLYSSGGTYGFAADDAHISGNLSCIPYRIYGIKYPTQEV